jgi:hypothetical protein
MNTTSEMTKPQRPFVAGFWLIAAMPMTVMILLPVAGALGPNARLAVMNMM